MGEVVGKLIVIAVVSAVAAMLFVLIPNYNVYLSAKRGEALLREAESTKRVMIEQAKAEKESAKLRAEAIKVIGEAAKKYPEYRQQEFIGAFAEALKEGKMQQIIYVPTEANVPLIESRSR